jgi:hypothetical protein
MMQYKGRWDVNNEDIRNLGTCLLASLIGERQWLDTGMQISNIAPDESI